MVKWLWKIIWGEKTRRRSRKRGWSLLRWFTPGLSISGAVAAILAAITGQINLPSLETLRGTEPPVYQDPMVATVDDPRRMPENATILPTGFQQTSPGSVPLKPGSSPSSASLANTRSDYAIRIATFNIQMFGKTKTGRTEVMEQIARIISQFDLVAIQEILGDPAVPLSALVQTLSRHGLRYQMIHSDPQGRTSHRECFAFVWDQTRVDFIPNSNYSIEDRNDFMHRPPFVASFQTRVAPRDGRYPFRFTLINVHTDPDLVKGEGQRNELNILDDVFQNVRQFEYENAGEDDYILLGDLNVSTKRLAELGRVPNVVSLVGDQPTNTRKTETYDHLLIDGQVTQEFVRRAGVMDLEAYLNIDQPSALKVSDHLPVWAEFSVYEAPRYATASRGGTLR